MFEKNCLVIYFFSEWKNQEVYTVKPPLLKAVYFLLDRT